MKIPKKETTESIYSNLDHQLDQNVKEKLQLNPKKLYAQHDSWNFCGYIWFDGIFWWEEIWRFNSPIETLSRKILEEVIEATNAKYGYQ